LSTLQFSRANNDNDFSSTGLPLGADYHQVDLMVGIKWSPTKYLTVEPKYSFYRYHPNQEVEFDDYNAHVLWLDFTLVVP
jgi:hypothetical protein